MHENATIGIIGGAGWLGRAISQSIVEAGIVPPERLTLSYRSAIPDLLPGARWTKDNAELLAGCDVAILSVRPQDLSSVAGDSGGKLLISVMAGVTMEKLQQRFRTSRVVRTLPNAAAEVRKSYTPWVASAHVTDEDRSLVQRIFETCGTADEVGSEQDIDYFTGLTGSGPAFPALLAAAMMDDAINRGIDSEVARRSVNALLVGTGRLVEARAECPRAVVETFLDYRGTTAAAIEAMREAGLARAVAEGLAAALYKSVQMGRSS